MILVVGRWKILAIGLCYAACCAAQDFHVAFRYDRDHVLFYVGKMQEPVMFSMADLKRLQMKAPLAEYAGGGYLLPLTLERLQTFRPAIASGFDEESDGAVPAFGRTLTVFLGGRTKIHASAEQYVEQYGMENPVIRVGVLARIFPGDTGRFSKTPESVFLITAKPGSAVPMTTTTAPCATCQKNVLNRFPALGELMLERGEKGWSIALYRETPTGLRRTTVGYAYGD